MFILKDPTKFHSKLKALFRQIIKKVLSDQERFVGGGF
jgi:hypothetical protein